MFKIKPEPLFEAVVQVPVPGGEPAPLTLIFKHKGRVEAAEFFDKLANSPEITSELLMDIISGWKDVDGEFNEENLTRLINNYHGVVSEIFSTYTRELAEGRRKN